MTEEQARVPKLRFPGFAGAWEQRKLGEIVKRVRGNDGRMDLPTLTISAGDGWMDQRERFSQNIAGKEQRNYTLLKKGELSYNHGNSKLAQYGAVFELESYTEALVPRVYHSFSVSGASDAKFLEQMFATHRPDRELRKLVSSGARMDGLLNINYDDFMGIRVCIPSVREQQAISQILVKLDNVIALHRRKLSHLELLKKGLLQKMFPKQGEAYPEIRFPGFSGAWEQCKLGDIAEFSKGRGYSKDDLRTDGDPIILYGRLYTDYEAVVSSVNTYVTKKPNSVLSRGDEIIVPASGETAEDIARASVVKTPGIILGGDLNVIRLKISFAPEFVVREISNGPCQKELSKKAQGKSVVHIHSSDLQEVVLKYPRLSEQRQISSFFASLDDLTALHRSKLSHLQQQKKALLQQMFV